MTVAVLVAILLASGAAGECTRGASQDSLGSIVFASDLKATVENSFNVCRMDAAPEIKAALPALAELVTTAYDNPG